MAYEGYCTNAELKNYTEELDLVRLCDNDGTKTSIGDAAVAAVLDELRQAADALIDGFILSRYSGVRGLETVPSLINEWSAKLTIVNAYGRRGKGNSYWRAEKELILSLLEKVAKGKLSIGLADSSSAQGQGETSFRTDADSDFETPSDSQRIYDDELLADL